MGTEIKSQLGEHPVWEEPEKTGDKTSLYQFLNTRLDSLIAEEPDWLANISNASDEASASEVVVPISQDGHIVAVLDLDSPSRNRFDETDASGLEYFVAILLKHVSFPF